MTACPSFSVDESDALRDFQFISQGCKGAGILPLPPRRM